jgi:hypothetical protein
MTTGCKAKAPNVNHEGEFAMRKTRILKALVVAAAMAIVSVLAVTGAPLASADTLGNGLTVSCTQESDVHATCVVGGCPRVNGDYVVDAVHAKINGGAQSEDDFKCISGQTARYGVDNNRAPVNIGVQGCRKKDFEGDWCTPYANYTFTPPAAPAAPVAPAAPAAPVAAPITCPADSPTKTVPAGGTCAVAPAPTDAVTMATKAAGIGKINVTFTNSANIAGTCDYTATPASNPLGVLPTINKSVAIKAKGTAALNGENAPPPLTSYHLSVTCTGDYNGQNVTFGHAETDVSG